MSDIVLGTSIFGVLIFAMVLDVIYVGLIIGFFLLALAYVAGCFKLKKGVNEQ